MIKVENVSIEILRDPFLKDVNFEIASGEIIRLNAPNGGGKSTIIESILGLRKISQGQIHSSLKDDEYGYLPQVAHQFPKIYLQFKDICDQEFSFYPKSLFEKNWHTSSGGERKKALIAKAMSEAKKLLILDEPFNHLDQISCKQVSNEIERLVKCGVSVLYTGHDHELENSRVIEVMKWR